MELAGGICDGEASHPGADPVAVARTRAAETAAALDLLGAAGIEVVRLRFPDTGLAACEEQLSAVLREQCAGFGVCLAPWKRTPMPITRPPAVRRGGPGA